jgi:hypothetical protein
MFSKLQVTTDIVSTFARYSRLKVCHAIPTFGYLIPPQSSTI